MPFASLLRPRFLLLLLLIGGGLLAGCRRIAPETATLPIEDVRPPSDEELRDRIDRVLLSTFRDRQLSAPKNGAWQIVHGILAYGRPFEIELTDERRRVRALDWLLAGGKLDGWALQPGEKGVKVLVEAGTKRGQGHEDQWLAKIAQADIPIDYPVMLGESRFVVGDIVKQAMHDVYDGKECSWTLTALTHYIPIDSEWQSRDGQTWTIERIMAMEAAQDIDSSACGGTHRLYGIQTALEVFRQKNPGVELTGGWLAGQKKIDEAIEKARAYQLPHGAFSVNYFARTGDSADVPDHIGATGHTLEFLTRAVSDEQLTAPWMTRAADRLCELMEIAAGSDLECGALYHAAHGLLLYRNRRFGTWHVPTEGGAVTSNPVPSS